MFDPMTRLDLFSTPELRQHLAAYRLALSTYGPDREGNEEQVIGRIVAELAARERE